MKAKLKKNGGKWNWIFLSGMLAFGCGQPAENANETEPTHEAPPAAADAPEPMPMPMPPLPEDATENDNEVAAVVNGHPVSMTEVRAIFDQMVPHRQQIPTEQYEAFWQAQMPVMLEMAIGQRLIQAEIAERNLVADEDAIDERLDEFRQDIPEDQTLESLTGRSTEELRQAIGEMLAFELLLDAHDLAPAKPTDEQIEVFYEEHEDEFQEAEQVEARHILLTVDEDADEDQRAAKLAEITVIRQELLDGADFAQIALAHSDCPSGQQGGSLGTFGRGAMVPPFETAAFSQEPGEIGPVVETSFGYHIIQVINREAARHVALEEARDRIEAHLLNEARQKQQSALVKKLQAEADIQYYAP